MNTFNPKDILASPAGVRYQVLSVGRDTITLLRLDSAAFSPFETALANLERYGYRKVEPEQSPAPAILPSPVEPVAPPPAAVEASPPQTEDPMTLELTP